jgi:GDSL-like Lipase/Acylhydrolase
MRFAGILLSFTSLCAPAGAQQAESFKNVRPGPPRLVVVGDSLSAGVQNFSLWEMQQPNGFASIIAKQAGWPLTLPLVPFPGAPNVLHVVSLGPPVDIEPEMGTLPLPPRIKPGVQPTNIAVPGLTVATALTLRPSFTASDAQTQWATIVLGFPNLTRGATTEIELAQKLKPNVVIEWLGNNDALVPALAGQINALTPVNQFALSYEQVLDRLWITGAKLITATIPDVTEIAFFTSAQSIARQTHLPLDYVTAALGIGPNDYVRPSAQTLIPDILLGLKPGPLPAMCDAPLPDLGVDKLPCVLTAAEAQTVRSAVNCYNGIIKTETALHGGVVVDIHALVDRIYSSGYSLGNQTLTADFFGGLFSLDGIHPTNTGYAVIANEFIKAMNTGLKLNIPAADVAAIFAQDPLRGYASPKFAARPVPPNPSPSCLTANRAGR